MGCSSDSADDDSQSGGSNANTISGKVTDEDRNAYPAIAISAFKGGQSFEEKTKSDGAYTIATKGTGSFSVSLEPPLATSILSPSPLSVNVQKGQPGKADFVIQPEILEAEVIAGSIDVLGELKNVSGNAPTGAQPIYASNVFDPPFGQLTAV